MPRRKKSVANQVQTALRRQEWRAKYGKMTIPHDPAERSALGQYLVATAASGGKIYGSEMGKKYRYRGSGDYSRIWQASHGLRHAAGDFLRAGHLGPWGTAAGNAARYLGIGDYETAMGGGAIDNALVGAGVGSAGIPTFGPEQAEYKITKTEFLRNIYAPTVPGAFQNLVLPLQPGLESTFPWLALVASQFEEYEFVQLMFYWRPMVSDFNSGTGQVGEIVMATQYNPGEAPFQDVSRAKNYMGAMSTKSSIPMNHGVECDPLRNSGAAGKYVRVGPLQGPNQDIKQYDLGTLNVMVSGTPPAYSDQVLGELWVAYTVVLRKPKLPDTGGDDILRDYFQSDAPTIPGGPGALSPSDYGGVLYGQQNRLGGSVRWVTGVVPPPYSTLSYAYAEYTVPPWFTGDLELTFTLIYTSGVAMQTLSGGNTVTGNITFIPDLGDGTVSVPTGIQPPAPVPSGHCAAGHSNPGDGPQNYIKIVHARVKESTGGAPNVIGIQVAAWNTATPPTFAGWSINVQEYNSSFNSPATNQVLLVDIDQNPVANPWSAP